MAQLGKNMVIQRGSILRVLFFLVYTHVAGPGTSAKEFFVKGNTVGRKRASFMHSILLRLPSIF